MGPASLSDGATPCGVVTCGIGPAEASLASRWTVEAGRQMRALHLSSVECTWPFLFLFSICVFESASQLSPRGASFIFVHWICHWRPFGLFMPCRAGYENSPPSREIDRERESCIVTYVYEHTSHSSNTRSLEVVFFAADWTLELVSKILN